MSTTNSVYLALDCIPGHHPGGQYSMECVRDPIDERMYSVFQHTKVTALDFYLLAGALVLVLVLYKLKKP